MHAGEVKKGSGQRANEDKFSAARVETIKAAEKWKEKCTPVRRAKAETGVQTKTKSPPAESKRPRRRRNRKKNARRRGEKRQRPTCKRRQNLRRQSRNCQGGGEMGRKMHAGEVRKGSGQRANGDKVPAASVQTETKSPPPACKGRQNPRRNDEERQRPACKRWKIPCRHSRNDHADEETK